MFDLTNRDSIIQTLNEEAETIYQQDPENDIALAEALFMSTLSSEELEALTENTRELAELCDLGILSEKSIVKFDKKAKLKRAEAQACLMIAREKKDRDFNKLLRVWKMRKFLLDRIYTRYIGQARGRARQMVKNVGKAKGSTAKKVVKRAK